MTDCLLRISREPMHYVYWSIMNFFKILGMHWLNLNLWWHYTISVIDFLVNHFPIQWLLMSLLSKVKLIHGTDGITVEADLVELAQKHVIDYAGKWKEQLKLHGQEDKFWDWEFKLQSMINKQPNREGYAIEYDGDTQGLMLIETQMHGSRLSEGKRLIYVDGIASAPWNREIIQSPPQLKGVGTALLAFARNRSIELGYEGRVGLHSLPGAEEFYDRQGMIDLGEDEDYDDLIYFEYGVHRFLEERSQG